MSVATIVLTNGRRDCIVQMAESLGHVHDRGRTIVVDDSGDQEYRDWLLSTFPDWHLEIVGDKPQGYDKAMQKVWEVAAYFPYVFIVEDDFVFQKFLYLDDLAFALEEHPALAQVVLIRQPWFGNEVASGGLINALVARGETVRLVDGNWWHRATWSTNPTVIRGGSWVEQHPWPSGEGSEWRFGLGIFEAGSFCAYWGEDPSEVWAKHIGERKGFGY